jgi:glucose/mannose transport system permease protein
VAIGRGPTASRTVCLETEVATNALATGAIRMRPRARRRRIPAPALLLAPSFLIVSIFVYVFIAYTIGVSLSKNWRPAKPNFAMNQPWYKNYHSLAVSPRFQADVRNTVILTVVFVVGSVVVGFFLAVLVHNALYAKGFFRGVFLLPYALSFVVTGVVWRWLFNPVTGVNLLLRYSGISTAYQHMTGHPLQPGWVTSPTVIGDVSGLFNKVLPGTHFIQAQLGIPVALIAVALAAGWQLTGFAMAMFLAGLTAVPSEVREAAMMDGASGRRYYLSVVVPMLKPITVTTAVILTYVALKMFDLVFAMSGSGVGFATDTPGVYVYETMYKALRPELAAAASIVMLVLVCAIVVPYLARHSRRQGSE